MIDGAEGIADRDDQRDLPPGTGFKAEFAAYPQGVEVRHRAAAELGLCYPA